MSAPDTGRPPEVDPVWVGDVIQISPEAKTMMSGCLAFVSEIREWGVLADVPVPAQRGKPPAAAPVRLAWADFRRVGRSHWRLSS